MIVDRATLAHFLDLSGSRVQQLCEEGMPRVGHGQYEVAACIDWYIDFRTRGGPLASADVNHARKRLYDAQVVKTQLESDRIRRETVPAAIHLQDMRELERIVAAALEGTAQPLAEALAGMADAADIAHRINTASNNIRAAIAAQLDAYRDSLKG